MSLINTQNFKNRHPTPNDAVYLKSLRFSCPFCKSFGPAKIYKNLWQLRYHFKDLHDLDSDCQKIISDLENLIEKGVLR